MPGDYYRPRKTDGDHHRPDYRPLISLDVLPSRDALQSSIKESYTLHCPQRSLPAKLGTNLKSVVMRLEDTKPRFIGHEGKDCGTSDKRNSGSWSSSYIPLSPSVPDAPQAQRCDTMKTENAIAGEVSAGTRMLCSSSSHSSIVAPWNDHQTVVGLGSDDDRVNKRTCKTSSERSPLPESIDRCDNYGCNSFHSHFDCPSGKKCWGCRSLNHFTSDCPMTCTNCYAAGHIPKYCEDFELDPRTGIARPRRPSFQPGFLANTFLPPLLGDKIYQCDNYPCRELHSHWDCPLPTACWGCRSSDHFWSGCHERCGKCGAQRHTAKYCDGFETWGKGMSRPIRLPEDIATNAMKRKRENEWQRSRTQPSQGLSCPGYPTPTSQQSSTSLQPTPAKPRLPTPRRDEFTIPLTGRKSPPSGTKPDRAEESRQEQNINNLEYISRIRTSPAYVPTTMDTLPARINDEKGNKIYCTFWLRTGRCAYRATTKGCSLLHKVPPDEPTRREIGISISAPWLRNDHIVQELERNSHGKPARSIGERANGPSSIQLRPSSKASRSYPESPNQAAFRSNKRLRDHDQEPEPLRARTANKSSSSLREPPKHQQNGKESVHEFFQSLGPPPEVLKMRQSSRTSTPTNSNPVAMTAELRPPQIPASLDSPSLQKENSPRPTVLKEGALLSQEGLAHKPGTPKTKPATILDASHMEESMSAAMRAFEEEEYRKQKSHEAAMARKMEEQKLEYEHELRMMELRKMKQT